MSNTLANLKACVPEFDPENLTDEGSNAEKRWKQWLENFECCLTFEGVTDPAAGPSKKRAALLAIGGQKLRELFATLTVENASYDAATAALNAHFTAEKNLTAERFKFFCMQPLDVNETHDHWITRLRTKVKDCEFDKMDDNEAIKLVITLHTHSEKLQSTIIQKDMDLSKVVSTARALELAKREVKFMRENPIHNDSTFAGGVNAIREGRDKRYGDNRDRDNRDQKPSYAKNKNNRRKNVIEICRYCGDKMPHKGRCKARDATCNHCKMKGHFEKNHMSCQLTFILGNSSKPLHFDDIFNQNNILAYHSR